MPRMSSGCLVAAQDQMVSPLAASASASSAKKTTLPVAAPGPAGRPLASRRPSAMAAFWPTAGRRPQQLVQCLRSTGAAPLLGDQLLLDHLDGDAHAGEASALAVAALQTCKAYRLDVN